MSSTGLSGKTQECLRQHSPQDKKTHLWRVFKRSKSLSDISTINQSKVDDQHREQPSTTDKDPARTTAARTSQPRTKRIKRSRSRQGRRVLLRNKGTKGRLNEEGSGAAAPIDEPEPCCSLKTTTEPENGFGLVSAAPASQDAVKLDPSFREPTSKTTSDKRTEAVSPVPKSKLHQHHPAEDLIQGNKAASLRVSRQRCLDHQAHRPDKDAFHERPGSSEEPGDQRSHEPAGQTLSECEEHNIQASNPCSPLDIRAGLERMTRHMHQRFSGNQVFVAEISRILSEILGSLQQWTSDVEKILNNKCVNESSRHNRGQSNHVMDPTLIKHVERSLTAPSAPPRDRSASRMLETSPIGCPEPLVFIDSYFTKPEEATAKGSRSDLGLSTSPNRHKGQSCDFVSVKYSKELKTPQCPSKVRKVVEDSSEEMEILAALPIMSVQEPRSRIETSARSSGTCQEELLVSYMDSCEEVLEKQNGLQRGAKDGEGVSVASRVKLRCSDSRKDKKSECSIC